jgi:hypothetical protein
MRRERVHAYQMTTIRGECTGLPKTSRLLLPRDDPSQGSPDSGLNLVARSSGCPRIRGSLAATHYVREGWEPHSQGACSARRNAFSGSSHLFQPHRCLIGENIEGWSRDSRSAPVALRHTALPRSVKNGWCSWLARKG